MTAPQTSELSHRPSYVEVNLGVLLHNYEVIKRNAAPAQVMPIIKANAYGHGLIACGEKLDKAGAPFLGVAYLEEGLKLRAAGVRTNIVVLGGIFTVQIDDYLKNNLDITASSIDKLKAIDARAVALGEKARIHLKIDTGLERIGQHYYTAEKLFEESIRCKASEIVGVYSHFATAESEDITTAKLQLKRFEEAVSFFNKRSLKMPLRHMGCSGSIMQFPESNLDIVRPGIALYGVAPSPNLEGRFDLKPVMSLRTQVVFFKVTKKGAGVSYGHTWKAAEDTRLVTLPIGYGDGYSTLLSNKGEALIRGNRYKIVGKVCMDQLMVNIGPKGEAYNTDEVILLGEQGGEKITMWDLCNLMGSQNPRELMTALNDRLPRKYV